MWSEFYGLIPVDLLTAINSFHAYHELVRSLLILYSTCFIALTLIGIWILNQILWLFFTKSLSAILFLEKWFYSLTDSFSRVKNLKSY